MAQADLAHRLQQFAGDQGIEPTGHRVQPQHRFARTQLDLTDAGSGLSLIGEVPASILAWMLLQVEQLARNRGATEVIERGQVSTMPFVDGLVERFRVYLP